MRRAWAALLAIAAGGIVSCADFPGKPPAPVSWGGRILDRDGAPMAEVYITIQPSPSDQGSGSSFVSTDLQGYFTTTLTQGSYRIAIYPGGGYPSRNLGVLQIGEDTPPLEYRYTGTMVSGNVTGPGGTALKGAYVQAQSMDFSLWANTNTSSTGDYALVLPPGGYQLVAEPGTSSAGIPTRVFSLSVSATDTTVDVDLGGHEIRYLVTLNGTTPLSGVNVAAVVPDVVHASDRTGADGRTTLYLPNGSYEIYASPYLDASITGEESFQTVSGPVEFQIDFVRAQWDVTLRWASDGSVIPFALVYFTELGGVGSGSVTADHAGRARLFVRPQRTHELLVGGPVSPTWRTAIAAGADSTFDLLVPGPNP